MLARKPSSPIWLGVLANDAKLTLGRCWRRLRAVRRRRPRIARASRAGASPCSSAKAVAWDAESARGVEADPDRLEVRARDAVMPSRAAVGRVACAADLHERREPFVHRHGAAIRDRRKHVLEAIGLLGPVAGVARYRAARSRSWSAAAASPPQIRTFPRSVSARASPARPRPPRRARIAASISRRTSSRPTPVWAGPVESEI